jgi:hypothetical protein
MNKIRKFVGDKEVRGVKSPVHVIEHLTGKVRQHTPQPNHDIIDIQSPSTGDFTQLTEHFSRLYFVENEQVVLRMTRLDGPRFERLRRKVFQVESQDERTIPPDRSRQHMPILFVVSEAGQ